MTDLEVLDLVEIGGHDTYDDPPVICPRCNATICTVEEGDSLGLLARTALGHLKDVCKS